CSSEYEFFLFKETPESIRAKGYSNLTPLTPGMFGYSWLRASENAPLVHALQDGLNAFDIEIEGFHTETGPGVYEAAIKYDSLLRAGDKAALFKTVVKEICARHGVMPCFMAKWNKELPGCSGHLHQSLWTLSGEPVFPDAHEGMSKTFQQYVAGQVALMPAFTALIAPTINSYKRMVRGAWSPTMATWGVDNRTTALRVIPGSPNSTRVEYRFAAADINPYIAMAASVASGLHGIEKQLQLPPETSGNGYEAKGQPLPATLRAATQALAESKEARELLGEQFVDHYVRTRDWECRQFDAAVTRWESRPRLSPTSRRTRPIATRSKESRRIARPERIQCSAWAEARRSTWRRPSRSWSITGRHSSSTTTPRAAMRRSLARCRPSS